MLDLIFEAKKDGPALFWPKCANCKVDVVYSQFENGIGRYICPVCKNQTYINVAQCTQARGYSIYNLKG